MYDKKNMLRIGAFVLVALGVAVLLWSLRSDPEPAGEHRINVERGFDETQRNQQSAGESLERIRAGLDDGTRSLERIERSADQSEAGARRIAGDLDALTEGNSAALERIEHAEAGNRGAETAIERAQQRIAECRERTAESERILAKYAP